MRVHGNGVMRTSWPNMQIYRLSKRVSSQTRAPCGLDLGHDSEEPVAAAPVLGSTPLSVLYKTGFQTEATPSSNQPTLSTKQARLRVAVQLCTVKVVIRPSLKKWIRAGKIAALNTLTIFKAFQGPLSKFKHIPGLEKVMSKFKHFQGFQGPVRTPSRIVYSEITHYRIKCSQ